jgi:hypothetical protein
LINNFIKFLLVLPFFAFAEEESGMQDHAQMTTMNQDHQSMKHNPPPIGVMGNMHHQGFMLSIRHGIMQMDGSILNGNNITDSKILKMPNELGNSPANLSVIPKSMDMKMTMIDGMYAPTNNLTLMVMATYVSKDMLLNTFSPMMERELIGQFSTDTSDLSDISFSGLFRINQNDNSKWHGEISLKKSIGKNDATAIALTPMGTKMNMIMPYAMQSGDESTSLILGLTNTRKLNRGIVWGNQLKRKIVVLESGWSYGDQTEFSSWIQYPFSNSVSISSRLKFTDQDALSGKNLLISAPVQTANPKNYGGKELHLGIGINMALDLLPGGKEHIGLEILKPLNQDKNNLQMKTDYQIIFGYQKSF